MSISHIAVWGEIQHDARTLAESTASMVEMQLDDGSLVEEVWP